MHEIQEILAQWFESNKRELTWRDHPSPYYVWLSEIILQQTRVNQGLDYFNRFIERWPTLEELAKADEEDVLKMWQGLGYYSRARNLHRCAKQVMERHGGSFPEQLEALKKLQGIGDYTAAAIASIAFGKPHAVVDGNVYRVLSRIFDLETPINTNEGSKTFAELAKNLLEKKHPGRHNQAVMEFGALFCVPKNPDCLRCPLQAHCLAFSHHTVANRPVKIPKNKVRTRFFNYLVIKDEHNNVILRKREGNDIWRNLYDFPCIESAQTLSIEEIVGSPEFKELIPQPHFQIHRFSPPLTHKLTHQTLIATFLEIKISVFLPLIQKNNILLVPENELEKYPIPKLIDNYQLLTPNFYGKFKQSHPHWPSRKRPGDHHI